MNEGTTDRRGVEINDTDMQDDELEPKKRPQKDRKMTGARLKASENSYPKYKSHTIILRNSTNTHNEQS